MTSAIRILIKKLEDTRVTILTPARGNVRIISSDEDHILKFTDEEHTLGAILQYLVLKTNSNVSENGFIGYRVPHPLSNEMVVRIRAPELTLEKMKEVFVNAINYGIETYTRILSSMPSE